MMLSTWRSTQHRGFAVRGNRSWDRAAKPTPYRALDVDHARRVCHWHYAGTLDVFAIL